MYGGNYTVRFAEMTITTDYSTTKVVRKAEVDENVFFYASDGTPRPFNQHAATFLKSEYKVSKFGKVELEYGSVSYSVDFKELVMIDTRS
jgi:hypothetical protein